MEKIAVMFPGQGIQKPGMGKLFYDRYPIVKNTFEEANDILHKSITDICFSNDIDLLTRTENLQPAIVTASVAYYRVYAEQTRQLPDFAFGQSLGEYSALCCAGSLTFHDTLQLCAARGKLMSEAASLTKSSMLAVIGVEKDALERACHEAVLPGEVLKISNYNGRSQMTVGGHNASVQQIKKLLESGGYRTVPLNVQAAFHTEIMGAAAQQFAEVLKGYSIEPPAYPVISNVTGLAHDPETIKEILVRHIVEPVRLYQSILYAYVSGVETFVDIGPGNSMENLVIQSNIAASTQAFEYTKVQAAGEVNRDKSYCLKALQKCQAIAVSTKNSNWNEEEYQQNVIAPYRNLHEMEMDLDKGKIQPSHELVEKARKLLKQILAAKNVSLDEQNKLLKSLQ